MRARIVGIGRPTEPSLRIESSPRSTQVIGDISVWPNTATFTAFGKHSAMSRRSVSEAGAAPQLITRSARSRSRTPGWAQIACHCVGTLNTTVARSRSQASIVAAASKAPRGWMTVGMPRTRFGATEPSPAMWNSGAVRNAMSDSSTMLIARMHATAWANRLTWSSMAPLGRPVVPDVYMINAGVCSGTSGATKPSSGSAISAATSSWTSDAPPSTTTRRRRSVIWATASTSGTRRCSTTITSASASSTM